MIRGRSGRAGLGALIAALVLVGAAYAVCLRDIRRLRCDLAASSLTVQSPYGTIEYAAWGDGPAVLALHGAGGGHDQARLLAETFGGEGFGWIAPSRFGYLRSSLPPDASTPSQADALAFLLDELGVERVSILAMSGGVPPALQLARRHPNRVSALVLLSAAPFTPLTATAQDLPAPAWLYQALFSADFPFWFLLRVAPRSLDGAFDIKPGMRATLSSGDRAFITGMTASFLPVTDRVAGLRNEGAAIDADSDYSIDSILIPTLVVHAGDDGINPVAIGELLAARIPDAEFMKLASGGHLLLGAHTAVNREVRRFLQAHAAGEESRE